mgnify:FL=1
MKAADLTPILKTADALVQSPDAPIDHLITDSRTLTDAATSLFFAIPTKRNNGNRYVEELHSKGVRSFVVAADSDPALLNRLRQLPAINLWLATDVVATLQRLAAWRRHRYAYPVVGITGSNGKTIVKEWASQLLHEDHRIAKNPKSWNSQIGVPLSVWQMTAQHQIALFEAGISQTGEMDAHKNVIDPTIGIFTNIGQAHDENFLSRSQKIAEKLLLFTHCQVLIYCTDHKEIHHLIAEKESLRQLNRFTWGTSDDNQVVLLQRQVNDTTTTLTIRHLDHTAAIDIPFIDRASAENAMHCITLLFYLGYNAQEIARRCATLVPVAMRLEMKEGINNCLLINDGYSLDINSLTIALDFVQHDRQHFNKTLIMSDFLQSGMAEQELYSLVSALIQQRGINKFIGIGHTLMRNRACFTQNSIDTFHAEFYPTTDDFIRRHPFSTFQSEAILLKGARIFQFENIAKLLQRKSHETIMEVNLTALIRNLNHYRSLISPTTKVMAMVKAASYGTGTIEIANTLQYNHVDYLTVAYSDEGIDLRRNGITLPIMVMNPEEESFDNIIRYHLEPDIYSFRILQIFNDTARLFLPPGERLPVHIEFDTGMHRLGFSGADIEPLHQFLTSPQCVLQVKSIFSHLACADDPTADTFTHTQISRFTHWSATLQSHLAAAALPTPMRHILNSSGIARFPQAQFDMVRLGIGLYGIAPEPHIQERLTLVSRVKARISQIKHIPQGDPVGYNGRHIATAPSRIAIIPIGYADGLNRHLGYSRGRVTIHGHEAPIVGSICMDMCFIDVTHIPCAEGDEVTIFGDAHLLKQMSAAADTIPYEILTSISPRVKRVYYSE